MINEACHVCFLSHTSEGKASDKSVAEFAGYTLPPGSYLYQDKGFQGFYLPERHDRPTQENTAWRRTHTP